MPVSHLVMIISVSDILLHALFTSCRVSFTLRLIELIRISLVTCTTLHTHTSLLFYSVTGIQKWNEDAL
jgi:hypothetical protein